MLKEQENTSDVDVCICDLLSPSRPSSHCIRILPSSAGLDDMNLKHAETPHLTSSHLLYWYLVPTLLIRAACRTAHGRVEASKWTLRMDYQRSRLWQVKVSISVLQSFVLVAAGGLCRGAEECPLILFKHIKITFYKVHLAENTVQLTVTCEIQLQTCRGCTLCNPGRLEEAAARRRPFSQ